MTGAVCLLVLFAMLQGIASQGPPPGLPEGCEQPPPFVQTPQDCCKVEPMYSEAELTECGFQKPEEGALPQRRQGPPDCEKPQCLLNKRGLLNEDKSINYEALSGYLDGWLQSNPEFQYAVDTAKSVCFGENGPPGPPQICEANRAMVCMGGVMFANCPTWQYTDDCKLLKNHIDKCKGPQFPPPN